MDRMSVSETDDTGSIPVGCTTSTHRCNFHPDANPLNIPN